MDFHSVEFYTIALFVAFALIGLIFGNSHRGPARTQIVAFQLEPTDDEASSEVSFSTLPDGNLLVRRPAITLHQGDTVNLVATLVDDKLTLAEKRGVTSRDTEPLTVNATAQIKAPYGMRLAIRYESELTGQWTTTSFTNADQRSKTAELRY